MLVHGGGRRATQVAARLGIESKMVNGRRITDSEMLEVVTMVYGGLVNKNLVARLQAAGVNALGLTGADMNVLRSRKRKPVTLQVREEKSEDTRTCTVDFGYVGDVECRLPDGQLTALIVPGPYRFFGLFGRGEEYRIPWECIKQIGDDIVLIDKPFPRQEIPRRERRTRRRF